MREAMEKIDFKKIQENAEARIMSALRVARSCNPNAARMTLSEAYQFVRAYNQEMHDTDPRRADWEKEYMEASELLEKIEEHEDYLAGRK